MIDNKKKLKKILSLEFSNYYTTRWNFIKSFLLRGGKSYIWRYQKSLRKLEYYKNVKMGGYLDGIKISCSYCIVEK